MCLLMFGARIGAILSIEKPLLMDIWISVILIDLDYAPLDDIEFGDIGMFGSWGSWTTCNWTDVYESLMTLMILTYTV